MRVTLERLRELLQYDPQTGEFTWRTKTTNRVKVGAIAGCRKVIGYWAIKIDGTIYYAHRLAWFYVHGNWPAQEIDHINLVKDDNRLTNLREATHAQNAINSRTRRHNKAGIKGVYFEVNRPKQQQWHAGIKANGKRQFIGRFATAEEARVAYQQAARKLHGEFARTE